MIRMIAVAVAGLFLSLGATGAEAQDAPAMTYELAERIAEAAEAEARSNEWNVTIVVTDTAGIPVYLKRFTGASVRSYDIAMAKAATVVATGLTTAEYGSMVQQEQIEAIEGGITFAGGVPVMLDGEMIGAVGTSGVRANQDEIISFAGARSIE